MEYYIVIVEDAPFVFATPEDVVDWSKREKIFNAVYVMEGTKRTSCWSYANFIIYYTTKRT